LKIPTCATFHTAFSAEFWQVNIYDWHFSRNIDMRESAIVIFPGILAFEMNFTVFFIENRLQDPAS
jgi:hypothetical protein